MFLLIQGAGWVGVVRPADGAKSKSATSWQSGSPMPIAVKDGKARFRVALPGPTSEVLVVVSALARSRGPFPIRLWARPADHPLPPRLADPGPRRSPRFQSAARALPAGAARDISPPQCRLFHLMVKDGDACSASNYAAVNGVLRGVGRHIQVYVALEDEQSVNAATVRDVIASFDDRIFPVAAERFGTADDVDGDGRFTVLMSSWLGHLGGGRYSVDGFVRVSDLEPAFHSPFGNRCDMMYLSSALHPGAHLRTIIAHEYMHAVVYSLKSQAARLHRRGPIEEEGWLDEAMAHLAEDLHGFSTTNIDYRVSAFLNQPEHYQLVVDDYYTADLFRSHGNRGSTYLFLRWCADKYGPELLPTLAGSNLRGIANLEAACGTSFADLFRQWTIALYADGQAQSAAWHQAPPPKDGPGCEKPHKGGDERDLAGPRFERITPGGPARDWPALGTTAHYVVVDGASSPCVEIEVSGPREAELQVTAMPLGRDLGRLDLSIRKSHSPTNGLCLQAHVRERHGVPVHLSSLSWEPQTPSPDPAKSLPHCGRLEGGQLAATFGAAAIAGHGELVSSPIPLNFDTMNSGPLVAKIIGTDANGRRVVGWAEIDVGSNTDDSEL